MKIELEIDESKIAGGVEEMFSSLTSEQRQAVALQVIRAWLEQPVETTRLARRQKIIDQLRGTHAHRHSSEADIEGSFSFREEMKKQTVLRERIIEMVVEETAKDARVAFAAILASHEGIQRDLRIAADAVLETAPKMLLDLVLETFAGAVVLAQNAGIFGTILDQSFMGSRHADPNNPKTRAQRLGRECFDAALERMRVGGSGK